MKKKAEGREQADNTVRVIEKCKDKHIVTVKYNGFNITPLWVAVSAAEAHYILISFDVWSFSLCPNSFHVVL